MSFAVIQGLLDIIQQQEVRILDQDKRLMELEAQMLEMELLLNSKQKTQPGIINWSGCGVLVGIGVVAIGDKMEVYLSGLSRRKP